MNLIVVRGQDDDQLTLQLTLPSLKYSGSSGGGGLFVLLDLYLFNPNWLVGRGYDFVLTLQRHDDLVLAMNLANEAAFLRCNLAWELTLSGDNSSAGRRNFDTD